MVFEQQIPELVCMVHLFKSEVIFLFLTRGILPISINKRKYRCSLPRERFKRENRENLSKRTAWLETSKGANIRQEPRIPERLQRTEELGLKEHYKFQQKQQRQATIKSRAWKRQQELGLSSSKRASLRHLQSSSPSSSSLSPDGAGS